MSEITKVPSCKISYPKDLTKLVLEFNPFEFPEINSTDSVLSNFYIGFSLTATPITENTTQIFIPYSDYYTDIISTLTGTNFNVINSDATLTGTATLFTQELQEGDVLKLTDNSETIIVTITSIESDTKAYINTLYEHDYYCVSGIRVRPKLEILATVFTDSSELIDGNYQLFVKMIYNDTQLEVESCFITYVYSNIYKCVEKAIFNLVQSCDVCPDISIIKYTLLLKGLLDAFEIAMRDTNNSIISDPISGSQLSINDIKEKIDRYCLLLNINCSSC